MHDNGHACIKVEIDCHLISMALLVQDLIRESGKEEKKKGIRQNDCKAQLRAEHSRIRRGSK